ncbi:MAG: hypothetical protein HYZ48_05775 [Chlamydiales bacterium]|nr:hypothetical protein [Chlamydiales bacterium]
MLRWCCVLFLLVSVCIAASDFAPPKKVKWKNRMRAKGVQNFDDFLHWTVPQHMRDYVVKEDLEVRILQIDFPEREEFIRWHGYFSPYAPLVGKVSKKKGDLQAACTLLGKVAQNSKGEPPLAIEEVLAKVIAYREWKVGDEIPLLSTVYRVEKVLDLWHGMPAFGLIDEKGEDPILLFRGTDFSLDMERGWASLISDVDLRGPGWTAFMKAQDQIHAWLLSVAQRGPKARVIGFSLGGVLAAYTFLYENRWVDLERSVAFHPPGLSDQTLRDWHFLPDEVKKKFRVYVARGDLVSKIGNLFGTVEELSLNHPLKPLRAHTLLFCAEGPFFCRQVDVEKENRMRLKK